MSAAASQPLLYLELLPPELRNMTRAYLNGPRAAFWHGAYSDHFRVDQLLESPQDMRLLMDNSFASASSAFGDDPLWVLKAYYERMWYERPLFEEERSKKAKEVLDEEEKSKKRRQHWEEEEPVNPKMRWSVNEDGEWFIEEDV